MKEKPEWELAPAKLNLGLEVLGKRPDGFHEIFSVFQAVNLYDELIITSSAKDGFEVSGIKVPEDESNLIIKTVELFRKKYGIKDKFRIQLNKRIPLGSGMGGGSSDAAACLRLLANRTNEDLSSKRIMEIALSVGSDVPFFIHSNKMNTAVITGRGEKVSYIKWPFSVYYVVIYPDIEISSTWAYGQLPLKFHKNISEKGGKVKENEVDFATLREKNGSEYEQCVRKISNKSVDADDFFPFLINDFERPVFLSYPLLHRMKRLMLNYGAVASLMSGSGSVVYGVFRDKKEAANTAKRLRNVGWSVFEVQPV